MRFLSLARLTAALAVTGTILAACVVVESDPGVRPTPPPGPPGRGDICTREYAPVCGERGRDRQTFGNACVARAEGFRVVHAGECRREGPPQPPPQACTQQYEPVCAQRGRDRRTFGNACSAESQGYQVSHAGECGGRPDIRGGGGRDQRGGRRG